MLSAATVRRPAVVLGAILSVLTLTGSAWGQSLGSVGSAVDATAESVEPVTGTVTGTTSKAVEPVTATVAKSTQPAQTAPTAPAESSPSVTRTVTQATQPVAATAPAATSTVEKATKSVAPLAQAAEPVVRAAASTVDTVASQATRPVEPLAAVAVDTVTDTLQATTTALPSETQALLGPLVETIDGQAEELTGSLLDSGAGLGGTVRAVTGALAPSQGTLQTSSQVWDGGESSGYAQTEASAQAASGPAARTPAPRGAMPLVAMAGDGASLAPPLLTAPATASDGVRPARQASAPGSPPAPSQPNAPASPASALGSSTGFSAASAVLAGLIALVLSALLGRLLPWSDTIRPLAFVSPPERPG